MISERAGTGYHAAQPARAGLSFRCSPGCRVNSLPSACTAVYSPLRRCNTSVRSMRRDIMVPPPPVLSGGHSSRFPPVVARSGQIARAWLRPQRVGPRRPAARAALPGVDAPCQPQRRSGRHRTRTPARQQQARQPRLALEAQSTELEMWPTTEQRSFASDLGCAAQPATGSAAAAGSAGRCSGSNSLGP